MDQHWTKIRKLFRAALDLDEKQREAFLKEQCGDDPEMRERLAYMLSNYENDETFLKSPIGNIEQHLVPKKGPEALVGTTIGPYKIRRVIAKGGMGVVFEAFDTKLEKIFALKMMHPELMQNESFRHRFEQEAKTLARLEDPHFVRVYALIEENSNTFIVMEYIHGITLAEHIRAKRKLTPREVAGVGIQLLAALSKAHKQNIIHRDLKPSNIMLTRTEDGKSLVKVLDFGIAKNLQNTGTDIRTVGTVGTLYYMSPEQIRALPDIDHRTDIYSSGVTLYEALNGALPFDITKDEFAIRKQIVEGKLNAATSSKYTANNEVEQVLAKALEIDPTRRFQTADEMRAALKTASPKNSAQIKKVPLALPAKQAEKKRRPLPGFWIPLGIVIVLLPILLYATSGYLPIFQQETESAEPPLSKSLSIVQSEQDAQASIIDTTATPSDRLVIQTPEREEPVNQEDQSTSQVQSENQLTSSEDFLGLEHETDISELVDVTKGDSIEMLPHDESTILNNPDSINQATITSSVESPPSTGDVVFFIKPASNIYVNNRDFGEANVLPLKLPAETHHFVIRNKELGMWECSLAIEANQETERYNVFLDKMISIPVTTVLQDSSFIRGASIILDGVPTGTETPMSIKVSTGLHSIEAELEGYQQEDVLVEGAEGCFRKINSNINFDSNINYTDKRITVVLKQIN